MTRRDAKQEGRGEFARIADLAHAFAKASSRGQGRSLELGIGDDAAVIRPKKRERIVLTVDAQVENVHFRTDWLSYEDIAARAFLAAASDVYAMGAAPTFALSALTVPKGLAEKDFRALTKGTRWAADYVGATVIGGNLTSGSALSITTTVLGSAKKVLERKAKVGDHVYLVGRLGLARAGLLAHLAKKTKRVGLAPALDAFRRPNLHRRPLENDPRGAIDVSDGLAQDLGHVVRANDVAVELDEAALAIHARATKLDLAARALGVSILDLVLTGGEDYALLVFAKKPPSKKAVLIGHVVRGAGLYLRTNEKSRRRLSTTGFDHFAH